MNAGANAAILYAAQQEKLIRQLREASATSFDRAIPLESSHVLQSLVDQGIVVRVPHGTYYLDLQQADALAAHRRKAVLIMGILFAVALAVYFLSR